MLQIRRGKRDNFGIIFPITPVKCMLQSIIRSVSRNGFSEGSQRMVLLRDKTKYLLIILNTPIYLGLKINGYNFKERISSIFGLAYFVINNNKKNSFYAIQ